MTRSNDEFPPPDVTATMNLSALQEGGEVDAELNSARLADSLPAGTALLVVRRGPNAGARFLLNTEVTTSGRHPDSDIFLDDVTVSRKHAAFVRDGNGFVVRDLGSLNGTYVGKDRVDEVHLQPGQDVQIGKYRLTYHPFHGPA